MRENAELFPSVFLKNEAKRLDSFDLTDQIDQKFFTNESYIVGRCSIRSE